MRIIILSHRSKSIQIVKAPKKQREVRNTDPNSVIACKVKESILEHATMSSRQNEPVTVEPSWVLRIVPHDFIIENVTHWSTPHRKTRVTRICLLNCINGQKPNSVDRFLHQRNLSGLVQCLNRSGSNTSVVVWNSTPSTWTWTWRGCFAWRVWLEAREWREGGEWDTVRRRRVEAIKVHSTSQKSLR